MDEYFSRREGLSSDYPKEIVYDDVPKAFKFDYRERILVKFMHYRERFGQPLEIGDLCKKLCLFFYVDLKCELDEYDSESSYYIFYREKLNQLLDSSEWFRFFDAIEYIGDLIKNTFYEREQDELKELWDQKFPLYDCYSYDNYQMYLNNLFEDYNIGWRLNNESKLERLDETGLREKVTGIREKVKSKFGPASIHLEKAANFIFQRPLDPENSIKESVSAIESIGKSVFPGTKTLGDVVKKLRSSDMIPMLASVIEKFYAFASSEPNIRHGGSVNSRVKIFDAELCLHIGSALVKYLYDYNENMLNKTE